MTIDSFPSTVKIGIIGLGYVGLPLAIKLAKKGFKVYGFDNDERKIKDLEHNYIYVDTIELKDFKKVKGKDNLIRNYGIGAQIIKDLKINKMILITKTPKKVVGLEGFNIKITKQELI